MKFCLWGDIGAAIKGKTIGGGELQMALLAKSLALSGHEVIVVDPFSDESFTTSEGVKVVHIPKWYRGIPFIRMFWYRIPALYKLLVKQKADYYYVRMRSYFHLLSYFAARKTGGKFIIGIASDLDIAGFRMKLKYEYKYKSKLDLIKYLTYHIPNDLVFDYILKRADYITLQHEGQRVNEKTISGKQAVFSNILDFNSLPKKGNPVKNHYVCAGSFTMLKGAASLFELLKAIDKKNKIIIVGEARGKEPRQIYEQLKTITNVELKGRLTHGETIEIISSSKALINMSNFEGFPNVFLEAWAMGIPVLSLKVNPGNIFDKHQLGLCFKNDIEEMKKYFAGNSIAATDPEKMIFYIHEHHDISNAGNRFLHFLDMA